MQSATRENAYLFAGNVFFTTETTRNIFCECTQIYKSCTNVFKQLTWLANMGMIF